MGVKLKRIVSCLVVVCLTFAFLMRLTYITERKDSQEKYTQFFEQEADFDVLFMGSSKVINGVMPMELWKDYGIVSYNMGGHANTIPTSYWVLRNALEYTNPKCVVFDCTGTGTQNRISDIFYYMHLSFDAFPLSLTKIQAALDLISPEQWSWKYAISNMIEILWNFSIYHGRWSELDKGSFVPCFTYQKGAESRVNVSIPAEMATASPEDRNTLESRGMQYLIKSIELCQERGIEIILTHLPYPASEPERIAANTVADVAQMYGVEYLNFFEMDVVDYQTDMYDKSSHLNPSGALKVTDYLGQVLTEQYGIPDQRDNPDYQSWHSDTEKYHQEKVDLLNNATYAWNYWMLLSDDDFSFVAEVSETDLQKDDVLAALLRNAGIQPEKIHGRCLVAADRVSGTVTYTEYETLLQGPVETPMGMLSVDGESVKLGEQLCWQEDPSALEPVVMCFALLNADGMVEGSTCFTTSNIKAPTIN